MRQPSPAIALASLLAAGLLVSGCAASPPWVSPEEHQRLVRQLLELERRSALSELEIARLQRRLGELEGVAVAPPVTAVPRTPPPAPAAVNEAPVPGWRELRGEIEESELAEIATGAEATPAASLGGYERGLALLRDGHAAEAESALAAFAGAEADSDLADNAWFWIGESRLARGDAAGAIAAYRTCLERYPDGNKVPDAMLKLGHAFAGEGDRAAAREVWAELVRRFPSTAAAETARGRLAAL